MTPPSNTSPTAPAAEPAPVGARRRDPNDPATWAVPARLSPSRLAEFTSCPRKFFYKSVAGLPDPAGVDALRGTVAHRVIERLFDLPRPQRTAAAAAALVDGSFTEIVAGGGYDHLRHLDDQVRGEVAALVDGYFRIEAPDRFDPHALELRLQARLAGVDVVGVLDRLDRHVDAAGVERWYISDLKTGKIPGARYLDKAFFAMRVYALLVDAELGVDVTALRLVYLRGDGPAAAIKTLPVDDQVRERTRRELGRIVAAIGTAAVTGDWAPKPGPLCNWCPFQPLCPAFHDGAEPDDGPFPRPVPAG